MSEREIQDTRTITISWCLATGAADGGNIAIRPPHNVLLNNLQFQSPDFVRLDLFSVANSGDSNTNLYVLQSSLTETDPIISFTGAKNTTVNISTTIAIKKPISQMNFQVQMLNTANQLVDPVFPVGGGANTGVFFSLTMTLIRLKKYDNDYVKMADNR